MKKFFTYMILAATTLLSQSCLFEDKELFEDSAAQRLDKATAETRELLESSPNGWLLEYYLGSEYSHGGFNFLVRFENGKASVSGEIASPVTWVETSSYGIVRDQGIVISFDTYNPIFHHLCEPQQSQVDGYEGDFELVVLSMDNDKIEVKGKKWGNHMTLTRMPEDKTWEETLNEIKEISDNIFFSYNGEFNGKKVIVELDQDNHIGMYWDEEENGEEAKEGSSDEEGGKEEAYEPFIYTAEGLKTRTPFEFGGCAFQRFKYDADTQTLTSVENPSFSIKAKLPEGYKTFSEVDEIINGKFRMSWYYGLYSKEVTIATNTSGDGWVMSGLIPNHDIAIKYNKLHGAAHIYVQNLGTDNTGDTIFLAAWDLAHGGNLTWSTEASVRLVPNAAGTVFNFTNGGTYSGLAPDSFILWAENASDQCSDSSFYPLGSPQLPYLRALTKVQ